MNNKWIFHVISLVMIAYKTRRHFEKDVILKSTPFIPSFRTRLRHFEIASFDNVLHDANKMQFLYQLHNFKTRAI